MERIKQLYINLCKGIPEVYIQKTPFGTLGHTHEWSDTGG